MYCDTWNLNININKSKVIIFSKGKENEKFNFKCGTSNLEIVETYKYLGITFFTMKI